MEGCWPGEPAELKKHACCFSTDSLRRPSRLWTMKSIQQQIEVINASADWEWRTCLLVLLRALRAGVLVLQLGGLIITETPFLGCNGALTIRTTHTNLLLLENPAPVLEWIQWKFNKSLLLVIIKRTKEFEDQNVLKVYWALRESDLTWHAVVLK